MSLLRHPKSRLVLWVVFLGAVAAATAAAHLSAWAIIGAEVAAWVIAVVGERALGVQSAAAVSPAAAVLEPTASVHVRVLSRGEEPAAPSAPDLGRSFAEAAETVQAGPAPNAEPQQWNIWTLERIVEENAAGDDELAYLVVYLREFAGADGVLPARFDALVRESFGPLLSSAA